MGIEEPNILSQAGPTESSQKNNENEVNLPADDVKKENYKREVNVEKLNEIKKQIEDQGIEPGDIVQLLYTNSGQASELRFDMLDVDGGMTFFELRRLGKNTYRQVTNIKEIILVKKGKD